MIYTLDFIRKKKRCHIFPDMTCLQLLAIEAVQQDLCFSIYICHAARSTAACRAAEAVTVLALVPCNS